MKARDLNADALRELISRPVSAAMVAHISNFAADILYCNPILKFPQQDASRRLNASRDVLPSLFDFINGLICATGVPTSTIISTLVYLTRLRLLLPGLYGSRCTAHRIFVATLILTAKYLNDYSPSNIEWAQYCRDSASGSSFYLCPRDITRLETQTLRLLGYNLSITAEDLYLVLEPFLRPVRQEICNNIFVNPNPSALRHTCQKKPLVEKRDTRLSLAERRTKKVGVGTLHS
jgi:hypothetical protein